MNKNRLLTKDFTSYFETYLWVKSNYSPDEIKWAEENHEIIGAFSSLTACGVSDVEEMTDNEAVGAFNYLVQEQSGRDSLEIAIKSGLLPDRVKEIFTSQSVRDSIIPPTGSPKDRRPTFVYVMHNRRNGYYKIGIAKNPSSRERTLQAEDPDTEILMQQPAFYDVEQSLHNHFSEKRIRGEWFALTQSDVAIIPSLIERYKAFSKIVGAGRIAITNRTTKIKTP